MAYQFKTPINFLFMFCKSCWNYQKCNLNKALDLNTVDALTDTTKIEMSCSHCLHIFNVPKKEIAKYYSEILKDE